MQPTSRVRPNVVASHSDRALPGERDLQQSQRRQWLVAGLAAGVIVSAGVLFNWTERGQVRDAMLRELTTNAELKAKQVSDWRNERLSDARYLTLAPAVAVDVAALLAQPDSMAARTAVAGWLESIKGGDRYESLLLFDPESQVRLSIPAGAAPLEGAWRELLAAALRGREPLMSDLHIPTTDGPAYLELLAPIFAPGARPAETGAKPIAVVVLRLRPEQYLFPLIQTWPTVTQSAEALLVRREGNEVVYLNGLRHRTEAAPRLRRPMDDSELPAARFLRGEKGVADGIDYRGVRVFAAACPVPHTPWIIVAKIDALEAFAPARQDALVTGVVVALLISTVILGTAFVGRARQGLLLRRALEAERMQKALAERLGFVTRHANDIILLWDEDLRIVEANERALTTYGYSLEEIRRKSLAELRAPDQRPEPAEDLTQAQSENGTVYEAIHQRRDGATLVVEVSRRSVVIDGRTFQLGVIRDITARRAAEAALRTSEERLRFALEGANEGLWDVQLPTGSVYLSPRGGEILGYRPDELSAIAPVWSELVHPDDRPRTQDRLNAYLEGRAEIFEVEQRLQTKSGAWKWVLARGKVTGRDLAGKPVRMTGTYADITDRKRAELELTRANRALRAISECNQVVVRALDEPQLLSEVCRLVVEFGSYRKAWVGYAGDEPAMSLRVMAQEGEGVVTTAGSDGPSAVCLRTGELLVCRRASCDPRFAAWFEETVGDAALLALPLRSDGRTMGVLTIHSVEMEAFDAAEIHLLADLADDLAYGIAVLRTREAQRQAERSRRASEELFRLLFASSLDAVLLTEPDGPVRAANPAACAMFGRTEEELRQGGRTGILDTTDPRLAVLLAERARTGRVLGELRLLRKDGTPFEAEVASAVFADQDGRRQASIIVRDITAQKRARDALQENEERLRLFIQHAPASLAMFDREMRYIDASRRWLTDYGLGDRELRGQSHYEVFPEIDEDWKAIHRRGLAGEVVRADEDRFVRANGSEQWLRWEVRPWHDAAGAVGGILIFSEDITSHKLMEARQRQGQRMEAVGTLAGGVAHDLNNILAPMLLVSGLLKDKLTDEGDREMLAMMQTGARRGAEIIKQLLVFSRGLEGKRVSVQPLHILKEMMAIMRETFPREIDLRLNLSPRLWTVVADPTQLHQVVLNLCVNARDAMPEGGHLTLSASNTTVSAGDGSVRPSAEPGPYVLIEVCDSGHGIPPEIKHRIFDPFFTTKPIGKGTGLGLATVLGIVQSHGGFVAVLSEPGSGSAFKVYLPATPEEGPAAPLADQAPPAPGRGQLILVVDDERNLREATRLVLEGQGYRVVNAINGKDALAEYLRRRSEIRLVLTDLMMPVMNGLTLIKALRALDPDLPILATSGLSDDAKQQELSELGVPETLKKPCDAQVLLEAIQRRLAPP